MTILITMIFLTLFVLFAFVINVGILISEKINLQNAADAAAYTGASMQARVLNKIGYLNYRLRQEWKEFAFHHWVTFARNELDHPVHWLAQTPAVPRPLDEPYKGPDKLLPCMCLAGKDYRGKASNFCKEGCTITLPGISAVHELFASPLTVAIGKTIEQARDITYAEWEELDRESPKFALEVYYEKYKKRTDHLYSLIEKYRDFLNEVGRQANPIVAQDAISNTVRETILKNLSHGNRDGFLGALSLIPDNSDSPWLKLDTMVAWFLITYARYVRDGDARVIQTVTEQRDMTLAVSKDRKIWTYYGIRLASKPKLIYLPEHWEPTLIAYATAKPFGSRIGPAGKRTPSGNVSSQTDEMIILSTQAGSVGSRGPNFSFYDFDELGLQSAGQMDIIKNYYFGAAEESSYPTANASNQNYHAIRAIRAPNHYESMRYSIFLDPSRNTMPGDNPLIDVYRYPDALEFDEARAALFPPDEGIRRASLFNINAPRLNANDTDGRGNDMMSFAAVDKWQDSTGHTAGRITARSSVLQTRTAWSNDYEYNNELGRAGYSVKLVSLNQIEGSFFKDPVTKTKTYIQNLPTGDANVEDTGFYPTGKRIWH